jgi:hypothetical protein
LWLALKASNFAFGRMAGVLELGRHEPKSALKPLFNAEYAVRPFPTSFAGKRDQRAADIVTQRRESS